MKVEWLGHACFLITAANGTRIITDPYAVDDRIRFAPVNAAAEVVLVSHGHFDHGNVAAVQGNPQVIKEAGQHQAAGMEFRGVAAFHDMSEGKQRGTNVLFSFPVDGLRLCHLGDLGHTLSPQQVKDLGSVDVLFIPVGGTYTVDASQANEVCNQLKPRVVIPMHFKNPKVGLPIAGVEDFLAKRSPVSHVKGSTVELLPGKLSAETIVLEPAR